MEATLEAVKREGRGKNEANRLRAGGRIPAVVYGTRKDGKAPEGVAVAVDPKTLLRILHSESGANTLISLRVDGGESRVMVKEYQLDPVTHHLSQSWERTNLLRVQGCSNRVCSCGTFQRGRIVVQGKRRFPSYLNL